jgi:hypothetical protein
VIGFSSIRELRLYIWKPIYSLYMTDLPLSNPSPLYITFVLLYTIFFGILVLRPSVLYSSYNYYNLVVFVSSSPLVFAILRSILYQLYGLPKPTLSSRSKESQYSLSANEVYSIFSDPTRIELRIASTRSAY